MPCSKTLTLLSTVKIFLQVSSSLSSHPRLPLTSLSASLLSPWCLQAVPSALLRFAEELLLGRAVSLQCCLLAMSSLHPSSPAQLSSRGPAQGSTFSAPSGVPPGALGLQGNLLGNRLRQTLVLPPSVKEKHLFPEIKFSSQRQSYIYMPHFLVLFLDRIPRERQAGISFTPAEGRDPGVNGGISSCVSTHGIWRRLSSLSCTPQSHRRWDSSCLTSRVSKMDTCRGAPCLSSHLN